MICDSSISRPAMRYASETVALTTGQKVELKMLRPSLGASSMDRIRNDRGSNPLDTCRQVREDTLDKG